MSNSEERLNINSLTKEEVIARIGQKNWHKFCNWMQGQTITMKNGEFGYYLCDVDRFAHILKGGIDYQVG